MSTQNANPQDSLQRLVRAHWTACGGWLVIELPGIIPLSLPAEIALDLEFAILAANREAVAAAMRPNEKLRDDAGNGAPATQKGN